MKTFNQWWEEEYGDGYDSGPAVAAWGAAMSECQAEIKKLESKNEGYKQDAISLRNAYSSQMREIQALKESLKEAEDAVTILGNDNAGWFREFKRVEDENKALKEELEKERAVVDFYAEYTAVSVKGSINDFSGDHVNDRRAILRQSERKDFK